MRYILLVSMVIFSFYGTAQDAFQRRDVFVSGGLSLGAYRTVNYSGAERAGKPLPFYVSGEYGLSNTFSVGPFLGYYSRLYRYTGSDVSDPTDDFVYKAHYTAFGLRGTAHVTPFAEKGLKADLYSEDVDIYFSGFLGYAVNTFSRTNGADIKSKPGIAWGVVAGARYFLNYRMALFAEAGPGLFGVASVGLTARF
ncbi:MAG: hypothetical protein K2X86_03870 [Cytophagaceae bacterium]|nr:hypothetical protein [Cytophagaceae bacterium]